MRAWSNDQAFCIEAIVEDERAEDTLRWRGPWSLSVSMDIARSCAGADGIQRVLSGWVSHVGVVRIPAFANTGIWPEGNPPPAAVAALWGPPQALAELTNSARPHRPLIDVCKTRGAHGARRAAPHVLARIDGILASRRRA